MKVTSSRLAFFLSVVCVAFGSRAVADTFGSGNNEFEIEFVRIGNPKNPSDTTGVPNPAGSVPYAYRMGKYEISEQMIDKANALGGLSITKDSRGPDKPATSASWFEAARFVNWLNESSGFVPAYKFDASGSFQVWTPGDAGYDTNNLFRNRLARYFLPSADEWYKAAFYDPAIDDFWRYSTGSNDPPFSMPFGTAPGTAVWNQPFEQGPADVALSGGRSPYGTIGQSGNVLEWEESEFDLLNNDPTAERGVRGGDWISSVTPLDLSSAFRNRALPDRVPQNVGFRVASVPEPSGLVLLVVCGTLLSRRRNRKQ